MQTYRDQDVKYQLGRCQEPSEQSLEVADPYSFGTQRTQNRETGVPTPSKGVRSDKLKPWH